MGDSRRRAPIVGNGTFALKACCRVGANAASRGSTMCSRQIVGSSKCAIACPSSHAKKASKKTALLSVLAKQHNLSTEPKTRSFAFLLSEQGTRLVLTAPGWQQKYPLALKLKRIALAKFYPGQGDVRPARRCWWKITRFLPKPLVSQEY